MLLEEWNTYVPERGELKNGLRSHIPNFEEHKLCERLSILNCGWTARMLGTFS